MQPIQEVNLYMYLFFVFFVIIGSFNTLNLIVGVIIKSLNDNRRGAKCFLELYMSEDQKKDCCCDDDSEGKTPKTIPRPKVS